MIRGRFRASVMKSGDCWKAVHRNAKDKIVWVCKHEHVNRDASTRKNGLSALDCAHGIDESTLEECILRREAAVALLKGVA